jgi:hypothetical protein
VGLRRAHANGRRGNPRPKNPPALIHESFSADYTVINQWAKRADGQWFTRSQYKDPRYGYKWGRWRETTERSLPLRLTPTRVTARLPRLEVEPAAEYDVVVDGRVVGRFETFAGASHAARDAHRPGSAARVVPRENGRGCSCHSRRPSSARTVANTARNTEAVDDRATSEIVYPDGRVHVTFGYRWKDGWFQVSRTKKATTYKTRASANRAIAAWSRGPARGNTTRRARAGRR